MMVCRFVWSKNLQPCNLTGKNISKCFISLITVADTSARKEKLPDFLSIYGRSFFLSTIFMDKYKTLAPHLILASVTLQAIDGRRTVWFERQGSTESRKPAGDEFERSSNEKGKALLISRSLFICICSMHIMLMQPFSFYTGPNFNWWN